MKEIFQPATTTDSRYLTRKLRAMTEIARVLASRAELPEILTAVLEATISVFEPAGAGAILLWDQPGGVLRTRAVAGYSGESPEGIELRPGESIPGKVFREGIAKLFASPAEVALAMQDLRPANRSLLLKASGSQLLPESAMAAPIEANGQKYGVLALDALDSSQSFTTEDLNILQSIADLIALAIERASRNARTGSVRQAHEVERLRAEMMATLSHELRLPLTAIKGYSSALLLDEVDWSLEKRREFLRLIEEECDTMQAMLVDLLDTSLITVNQLPMKHQPLHLPQIAREVATEMSHNAQQHHLMVEFPPVFPVVEADPQRIRQVLRNILDNAIKFSPQGGLVVIRGDVRPPQVIVRVSDQGVGIPPEDQTSLFDMFFRARTPEGTQIPGTGLGLPVARAIVEAHGGHIWADSKPGQGTTLSFSLPYNNSTEGQR